MNIDLAPALSRAHAVVNGLLLAIPSGLVRQAICLGDRSAHPFDNEMDRTELDGAYRAALAVLGARPTSS